MEAMGLAKYSSDQIKQATLAKMKQDGVYQNAINRLQFLEGLSKSPADVIKENFCSPNCSKDHEHKFLHDYDKNYTDPIDERPGVSFLLEMPMDEQDETEYESCFSGLK